MSASDHWHNRFSFATLGHRLRSVPMLVVLIPFVLGIVLAEHFVLPLWLACGVLLGVVVLAAIAIPRKVVWGYIAVALLMFGYVVAELRAPATAVPYNTTVEMVVEVESIPSNRGDYCRADGRIIEWRDGDEWRETDSRVVLWLRTDGISHGDRLTLAGELSRDISRYDDYNRLMHRRGFVGGVGVGDYNLLGVSYSEPTDMQSRAVAKLDRFTTDSASHATVVAMVAGSRHDMPTELRESYSETGLSHLMAVSGLHLGMVLMVVGFIFKPLRLIHRGHRIAATLSIVAIWLYAIMCGASPSVIRAAIMLTVLQLSLISSARYSSLNALMATVFVMLVYRPNYLFDVSFQLSVAAVIGIVVWGVPLMRLSRGWHWVWSGLYSLVVVGVVATLWTLPIVSYTFDSMPIVGVVVTPCVLIFAYIIVVCGLFVLALPLSVAAPFAAAAEWAAGVQNSVVGWAAELPFASIGYTMSGWEVSTIYAIFTIITAIIWSINRKKVVSLSRYDFEE